VAGALERLPELRKRIAADAELRHRFSFEAQVPVLGRIYSELLLDSAAPAGS
jgi:hypothetical protein